MPSPAIPLKRVLLQDAADRKHEALRALTVAFANCAHPPGDAAGIDKMRNDLENAERAFLRAHTYFRDLLWDARFNGKE